ncbi:ligase-associated DNA damage response endonuclease PdeM [Maribacter antarcticus]|uniref:ligase-associated DNA damage response endonuclease PdeM n=1 Tax=Maribacter antarcticus TaxID=505250 RepID=UPI0006869FD7|nr:ligase-associated DNA damage response endonuclease PdeM [Maribacter antarcticus]
MTESIKIHNQNFIMHASGVFFWKERSMLLISDVHLGKVSHFRKFGAAVPQQVVQKNFESMNTAIQYFNPKRIVFMGDLFHSSLNKEWELFEIWTAEQSSSIILVSGNHDIISPLKYEKLGIQVVEELILDNFLLTHHPEERDGFFNFCGHIHPAIKLTGLGRQTVRLPCFYKSPIQLILPAFGEFTGTYTLQAKKDCKVFALLGDAVLPVTLTESKRKGRSAKG